MDLVDLFYREGKIAEVKYLQRGIRIKLSLPRVVFNKLLNSNQIQEAG
jgi:hypothetical protein